MKMLPSASETTRRGRALETFLEALTILLAVAAVAISLWALPIWALVALYVGVLAGGLTIAGINQALEGWHARHHASASRLLHHR